MRVGRLQPTIYPPTGDHPKGGNLPTRHGFTLVEVMLAIALVAVVLVAGFDLLWQVIGAQTKSLALREVQQNARLALLRMEAEIRGASDIKAGAGESLFGAHPGKLTLDEPGVGTDVVFDTATKVISVSGSNVEIRKLRVTVGAGSPVELTSDRVDVTNLKFGNLTHGNTPDTVRVDLTVQAVNPANDQNRRAVDSLGTTVTLRR